MYASFDWLIALVKELQWHFRNTNGYGDGESDEVKHVVHSLDEKLKAMQLEEDNEGHQQVTEESR